MKHLSSLALAAALAVLPVAVTAAPAVVATRADPQTLAAIKARAEKGDATSQYAYGYAYLHGNYGQTVDPAEAAVWLGKAADGGNASAAFELAKLYSTGKGVEADPAKAAALYQKAADGGNPEVAGHVCQGATANAGPEIWTAAFPFCQKASAQGSIEANYTLGVAYLEGRGIAADTAQGIQFLQRAAGKGNLPAMTRLAQVYSEGSLVPQDYARALNWHRQAARYGSPQAVRAMARQYETGQGTAVNMAEAARLHEILARNGDAEADAWLKAHPEFPRSQLTANIITLENIPSGQILYAVVSHDPRFTTLDMAGYVRQMSLDIYPMKALEAEKEGMATAECRFTADGGFRDCVVVEENPAGYGFGPSILRMMDALQNSGNKTTWSSRYAGKVLRITARWKLNTDPTLAAGRPLW